MVGHSRKIERTFKLHRPEIRAVEANGRRNYRFAFGKKVGIFRGDLGAPYPSIKRIGRMDVQIPEVQILQRVIVGTGSTLFSVVYPVDRGIGLGTAGPEKTTEGKRYEKP
mgnify:CR=1 FL=1